jgi:ribonuclease D
MGKKWTEVDIYTGLLKTEDMPTNAAGRGAVAGIGVGPDGEPGVMPKRKKKKKKTLVDARTKAYREHRKRLEQARERRLAKKEQSSLIKKVKEQIGEFSREEYIEEDNVAELKDIVKRKSAKNLKFKDGSMKVDMFTASAMTQILDKVKPDNKKKMMDMINSGTKSQFMKLQQLAMKAVK